MLHTALLSLWSPTCYHDSSAKRPVTCDNSCKHHPHNCLLRWPREDLHKTSPWSHITQHYHRTQPPLPSPLSTMFSSESLMDPDDWSSLASWLSALLGPLSHTACLCLKDLLAVGGEEGGRSYIGGRGEGSKHLHCHAAHSSAMWTCATSVLWGCLSIIESPVLHCRWQEM